ncbi:SGNH/GDSL hydrolase family protein [Candidatus Omnitrophota bacterium]
MVFLTIAISIAVIESSFRIYYRLRYKKAYQFRPRLNFKKMIMEPHPYLPYVHKKHFYYENDMPVNYPLNKEKKYKFRSLRTNNFRHLNGPKGDRDIVIPKPNDLIRINCVGGSTTVNYIWDNNIPYSYPMELEKVLNGTFPEVDIEVNNCGQGGYSSAENLIKFLLDTIDTKPDIVVLYSAYNDLPPSLTNGFQSDYSHYRRNLGEVYHFYKIASMVPYLPLAFWNFLIDRYIFYSRNIQFDVIGATTRENTEISNEFLGLNTYRRNIEHLINICKANDINVILSTFCHYLYPQVKEDKVYLKYHEGVRLENEIVRELAVKHGLALVDNESMIPREDKYFVDSVHFSPEGMRLLAINFAEPVIEYLNRKIR